MCGICGFITKENIGLDKLKAMNDTMYHRGPNDSGEEIYPSSKGYNVGLAQRRLSILDLSPLGHQPYVSEDKRVVIVFNGEIYNFQELKKELNGYNFKSNCDTEVILAAYLKWGIKAIEKFNGMFAIAIFDRDKDKIYLCRDRIGKKPLYYWLEGENIVFGSELKPIMKAFEYINISKTVNKKVMARYIYQKYITSPDTIFENVYQVEPGRSISINIGENLSVNKACFWDINTIYHEKKGTGPNNFEEAKSELKKILEKAVRNRMISDVPLGTFLSGGYDSSLITAVAQSISDIPVKTFCVGFEDEKYNEAKYAAEVAKHLGTKHTEYYIGESDMLSLVESIPKYYDEPFADSSQIATMLVSKLAKNDVTVALSGDGGDEFFCGYNIYKKVEQAQKLDLLGEIAHRAGRLGNLEAKYPFKLRVISQNRNLEAKTQFIAGNYIKVAENMIRVEGARPCFYDWESRYTEDNWQERRMLLDMETYLPSDILCKVDRASMKYSLETRCPILDREVMEFAFSLPHEFKYKNGIKKYILKELAYDYIPRELLDRPKTGFAVPVDKWLRGVLKNQLLDYTDKDYLKRQGIFEPEYTSEFIRKYLKTGDAGSGSGANYSRTVWAVFVFQQWYEYYMKQV
jgi:asparagine synthase (glutamine-hydrolysing)